MIGSPSPTPAFDTPRFRRNQCIIRIAAAPVVNRMNVLGSGIKPRPPPPPLPLRTRQLMRRLRSWPPPLPGKCSARDSGPRLTRTAARPAADSQFESARRWQPICRSAEASATAPRAVAVSPFRCGEPRPYGREQGAQLQCASIAWHAGWTQVAAAHPSPARAERAQ